MPSQYRINKIVEIGDTLHRSGCAPYKVEKYTQHYAQKHGVDVMIQATPTAINYQFPDDNNAVVLKRLKPASINLSLLANTIIRINQPSSEPVPEPAGYPSWVIALANMGIPPAYLMLVGSTLEAVGFAFILGFMVWGCQQVCRARRAIAVEFIAALFTGIIVAYLSSTGLPIPVWALCIATIVLFVPGLSIANSLECLAFNDLVSGTSLLGQCALTLIKLFVGITMGLNIGEAIWGQAQSIAYTNEIPIWMHISGLFLISASLGVIFNASPYRHSAWLTRCNAGDVGAILSRLRKWLGGWNLGNDRSNYTLRHMDCEKDGADRFYLHCSGHHYSGSRQSRLGQCESIGI